MLFSSFLLSFVAYYNAYSCKFLLRKSCHTVEFMSDLSPCDVDILMTFRTDQQKPMNNSGGFIVPMTVRTSDMSPIGAEVLVNLSVQISRKSMNLSGDFLLGYQSPMNLIT